MDIFDALNATLGSVNPPGGVVWSIAFEPLAGAMLSGKKDNVLGIGQDDNGFSKSPWASIWWSTQLTCISRPLIGIVAGRRVKGRGE